MHRNVPRDLIPRRRGRVIAVAAAITLVAAVLTAVSLAFPQQPRWTTVFRDGFSGAAGSRVDSNWTYDTGTQYNGPGCTGSWGTGEVESNTTSTANVATDGRGHLTITPVSSNGAWTSGRIESVARFAAPPGGKLEVSASIKQPSPASGLGYWPAFWMLGAGLRTSGAGTSGTMTCPHWPSVGEIDIMEDVNGLSQHSGTFHCGTDPGGTCHEPNGMASGLRPCSGCQTRYNTYSVIVDRTSTSNESITWYLNGRAFHTVNESQIPASTWRQAVDHGFFLILDVAMGGSYPYNTCHCTTPTASTTSGAAMRVANVTVRQTKS